jgi:hypothetical protein
VNQNPFSKGPTLKFLDSTRQFDVVYRYRLPGEATWTLGKIGMTARSPKDCERRCIQFLSQRHRAEVEVMKVTVSSDEMPIQTGEPVKVASQGEYEAETEKALADTEEERKENLRRKGFWLP